MTLSKVCTTIPPAVTKGGSLVDEWRLQQQLQQKGVMYERGIKNDNQ